jgi:hypothetical protein
MGRGRGRMGEQNAAWEKQDDSGKSALVETNLGEGLNPRKRLNFDVSGTNEGTLMLAGLGNKVSDIIGKFDNGPTMDVQNVENTPGKV